MTRVFTLLVTVIATAFAALATDELPRNESNEPDSFDIEPPLLKQNLSTEQLPTTPSPGDTVGREPQTLQLLQLLREAREGKRQCVFVCGAPGSGKTALVESFLLQATEDGQVSAPCVMRGHCFEQFGTGEPYMPVWEALAGLARAKATLAQLTDVAQSAAARRERAELDAAEANVRRQQKLLALGSAHKSDVNRAQEKLAELKSPKN